MFHGECRLSITELRHELHNTQNEAARHSAQLNEEADRANQNAKALRKAEQENNELHRQLAATQAREKALLEQVEDLRRLLESTHQPQQTQEETAHRKRLEARRSRAAETCMVLAWEHPGSETSARSADVAQAVLSLPVEAFDVTVEFGQDVTQERYWRINGAPLDNLPVGDPTRAPLHSKPEELLIRRYGITRQELNGLEQALEENIRKQPKEERDQGEVVWATLHP